VRHASLIEIKPKLRATLLSASTKSFIEKGYEQCIITLVTQKQRIMGFVYIYLSVIIAKDIKNVEDMEKSYFEVSLLRFSPWLCNLKKQNPFTSIIWHMHQIYAERSQPHASLFAVTRAPKWRISAEWSRPSKCEAFLAAAAFIDS